MPPPVTNRSLGGWATGVVATLLIWAAVYTIAHLRAEIQQYHGARQTIAQIGAAVAREEALAWRGAAGGGAEGDWRQQVAAVRQDVAQLSQALLAPPELAGPAHTLQQRLRGYQAALDRRMDAEPGAPAEEAQRELEAQSAWLRDELRRIGADADVATAARERAADVSSVLVLIATVCATGGVLSLFSRTKRAAEASRIAHEQRLASETRFRALVQHSSDVVFVLSREGQVSYASSSVQTVFGVPEGEFVGSMLWDYVHPDDRAAAETFVEAVARSQGAGRRQVLRMRTGGDRWLHIESLASDFTRDPLIAGILVNGRDITERVLLEQKLSFQALHDPLTGLANRLLFQDRVEQALAHGRRSGDQSAVLFIDLDNFKTINDCWGHAHGDELLREVAGRLLRTTRGSDSVARFGGDEFAVLVNRVTGPDDVLTVVQRIDSALREPVVVGDRDILITGSIGIAMSAEAASAEEILRNADVAMYVAKGEGKHSWCVFEPEMHATIMQRNQLETDLRGAVENGGLHLAFQPLVDLKGGGIYGVEALVRWNHPERGPIPPSEFIPIAEETGLIIPLGRWVLENACRQVSEWSSLWGDETPLLLSVNISGRQLQDDRIVDEVVEALRRTGMRPGSLILEITESVLMQNTETTLLRLSALKELGVQLAIDDFGTGYSSLAYLRMFPIDALKIDRRFVSDLESDDDHTGLAKAILSLGETLGLRTIAEGIETELQRSKLCLLGCQFGQGFYFARPLEPAQVEDHLRTRAATRAAVA